MAIGIVLPSIPVAVSSLGLVSGESGATPPLAAAIQLTTLRNDPMSTTAGKGSHPFSRIRTVFRPVGCVASGTSTSPATSSAPHAIAPRRWRRMVFSAKSKSHSKRDRKSNPSKPPTTSGRPAAERSVTTASSGPSVSDPTLTASMVIFCRTVSPMEPRPRIAAPSRHSSPIISRSFGDTNAAVAPESMRKSTRPPFAPTSRVMRTYPARGFPGMPTIWRSGTRTASSRFASHASASARARDPPSRRTARRPRRRTGRGTV